VEVNGAMLGTMCESEWWERYCGGEWCHDGNDIVEVNDIMERNDIVEVNDVMPGTILWK
jgi:hypothetical protein